MIEFYIREIKHFIFRFILHTILLFSLGVIAYSYYRHKDIELKLLLHTMEQASENYILILILICLTFSYQIYTLIKTYKFRQLPYTFQFLNKTNESASKIYDRYIKKKNGYYLYKNSSHRIDFKHYKIGRAHV